MDQLVTCGGMDCSLCSLLQTISGAFSLLIGISSIVGSMFLVAGGFTYLTAFGHDKKHRKAKRSIRYALWGFGLALLSFLFVNIVFVIAGAKNSLSWWKIDCVTQNTGGLIEGRKEPLKQIYSRISNDIGDTAPIIKKMSSLNQITDSNKKIGIFDLEKIDSKNLKQDLINLFSGDSFRLLAVNENLSDEDIADYTLLDSGFSGKTSNEKTNEVIKQIEKIADFRKDDGDISLVTNENNESSSSTLWWSDSDLDKKLNDLINKLDKRNDVKIVAYKDSRAQGSLNYCVDSEGDYREFTNECQAKKATCGNQSLACSNTYHPTMGCQCSAGSCSVNGKCVKEESYREAESFADTLNGDQEDDKDKDSDGDGVLNDLDHCPNTPTGEVANKDRSDYNYGCSCSQISLVYRSCAQSRCEGENWVEYPISGYDSCKDGQVIKHSCEAKLSSGQDYRCFRNENINDNQSNQNQSTSKSDWWNNNTNSGSSNGDTGQSGSDDSGNTGNGGNTGSNGKNNGEQTGNGQNTDNGKMPPDLGPGNFNPTPSFKELAECIGFKDGKVPYNGVLVVLLNKEDPTNERHPSNNASRLFYLTREGKVIGNAGDPNGGGLKVGPWTKGSGGTAWSPGWAIIPNAQGVHSGSSGPDQWSFRSGDGHRVGPQGEKMNHNGTLNPNGGKVQDMSGCNMHSGNKRSHSAGCMTMGGNERKGLTDTVKKMATKSGGKVLIARLIADNSDPNSQQVKSEYCGKMDPEKAINQFKTLRQYQNYNPYEGY